MQKFLKLSACAAGLAGVLSFASPQSAQASCDPSAYLGSVCFTAISFCPKGFLKADGAIIPVNQNQALYSLLGNNFGGIEPNTFGLPDLRGRSPVGIGARPGTDVPVGRGQQRGTPTTTLMEDQLSVHDHSIDMSDATLSGSLKVQNMLTDQADSPTDSYLAPTASPTSPSFGSDAQSGITMAKNAVQGDVTSGPTQTASTGSGQSFDSLGPRLALTACVQGAGPYPPHD